MAVPSPGPPRVPQHTTDDDGRLAAHTGAVADHVAENARKKHGEQLCLPPPYTIASCSGRGVRRVSASTQLGCKLRASVVHYGRTMVLGPCAYSLTGCSQP
ncbi:MAG: hypothetical protein Q7R81_07995 [Candidatus Peregrinibacteria bacterium]|nr:hypothetical protein [Candidatus Peregrinibacteria bacterium]